MERSLFKPIMINKMSLNNRLVRSATYESMAAEDGSVTDQFIELYKTLAKGGVGLIITGYAYVQENGRCTPFQTGAFRDDNIPGLRKLVDAVHAEGGKIALEIVHSGPQMSRSANRQADPEVWFRIVHLSQVGHPGAPVAACREQTVEIALGGPKTRLKTATSAA